MIKPDSKLHHIVIGGGGLELVSHLGNNIDKRKRAKITLFMLSLPITKIMKKSFQKDNVLWH